MKPAHSVHALRAQARSRLPGPLFDFIDGGAEDEATLRANEASFADWAILPRPLEGAATRDLSITLFGQRLASPVLVGPTGLAGLFWPRGEIAAAQAAAEHGTVYCLSHGSVCTLEELAQSHHGQRWMQVFIYKDRAFTRELVDRARAAGYQGLVVTVDNQLLGKRERDLANGFSIPPRFGPRQWFQFAGKLPWWWSMRRHLPQVTFGNYVREGVAESVAGLAGRMASMLDPGMGWDDITEVRRQWDGPLLIKGLLHPQVLQTLDSELDRTMGLAGVRQASALASLATSLLVPNGPAYGHGQGAAVPPAPEPAPAPPPEPTTPSTTHPR